MRLRIDLFEIYQNNSLNPYIYIINERIDK